MLEQKYLVLGAVGLLIFSLGIAMQPTVEETIDSFTPREVTSDLYLSPGYDTEDKNIDYIDNANPDLTAYVTLKSNYTELNPRLILRDSNDTIIANESIEDQHEDDKEIDYSYTIDKSNTTIGDKLKEPYLWSGKVVAEGTTVLEREVAFLATGVSPDETSTETYYNNICG